MIRTERIVSDVAVVCAGIAFAAGLVVLGVKLKSVQVDSAAAYNFEKSRQSTRLVQTAAPRGRILDRSGRVLAENKRTFSIVLSPEACQQKTFEGTLSAITGALSSVSRIVGVEVPESAFDLERIRRHLVRSQALPYRVLRDVDERAVARLFEHGDELPGFGCVEEYERRYPGGSLAAHVIGYVGREEADGVTGDEKINFREKELAGRSGMESYCDAFLRGVSGERRLTVDARGFTVREEEICPAIQGPDLVLTLDVPLQRAVERELAGLRGACVVLDAKDGAVLALASAPSYNLNDFVPYLTHEKYFALTNSMDHPLVNRACGSAYAPGSTFKPITALAALAAGADPQEKYLCCGFFEYGAMTLSCSRRWGHGELDMAEALRDSCNPYFAVFGMMAGTNLVCETAHKFGLGSRTGIDFHSDAAGLVPDEQSYGSRWWSGELAHIAIGQGRLLASPLQMAVVVGALGTGRLVTPRLNAATKPRVRPLQVPAEHLDVVREGMRMVVGKNGTGSAGAEGVNAYVIGKTGTAEVGSLAHRRKNTWFIAYAKATDASGARARAAKAEVAVAMVIENGESGGHTTAPKVAAVLRGVFN